MKKTLIPTTLEELLEYVDHHELNAIITEFEVKNNGDLRIFGLPQQVIINLSMVCEDKNKEEILNEDIFAE